MRMWACCLALVLATAAHAEVTNMGGFKLGQKVKKPKSANATVFGCAGSVRPEIDKKKQVTSVEFEPKGCAADALTATITKEFGAEPIANVAGDKLWEGKAASVMFLASAITPVVRLVKPGGGSKRVCWPDDGFAAFWDTFKKGVASGKPAAIAASFVFPLKDFEGTVKFKNARAFEAGWTELITADDAKALAAGQVEPVCNVTGAEYSISLEGSYSSLTATQKAGAWQWSEYGTESPE